MHYGKKIGKTFSEIALLGLVAAAPVCNRPESREEAGPKEPTVAIEREGGTKVRVKVELAVTEEERATGLMYREKLDKGTGMLFIFDEPEVHSFWMKNTYIPLDMIFIGSDLGIAGVVENAVPMTLTPRGVGKESQYVLEVEGGFCAKYGVRKGMKTTFNGFKY
jgi:uncharacterized membrane protein (UPF0127 family)